VVDYLCNGSYVQLPIVARHAKNSLASDVPAKGLPP
jgi:hypothetical protein